MSAHRVEALGPEWKYVTVKRSFVFIEHSMNWGPQWVVFEPSERSSTPTAGSDGPLAHHRGDDRLIGVSPPSRRTGHLGRYPAGAAVVQAQT